VRRAAAEGSCTGIEYAVYTLAIDCFDIFWILALLLVVAVVADV